jgi:hypothetical protein
VRRRVRCMREERRPHVSAELRAFLREHWILVAILSVGIGVRLYAFGSVPPGFNQDEAALGYDAFALLNYGIDRNGFHNPVLLVSWGSGMNALPGYLAMPLFLLFDVSVASLRGVNLIAGILSLPAFYFLVRETGDKTLALLATFLLAISPWHIMISRWGLESNLLPALFVFGVLYFNRGRENARSLLWAAVFFALTLYAYGTAYLATPLFLVLASFIFVKHRPRTWKPLVQAAVVFCVLALPIALTLIVNQFKLDSIETRFLSIPRLPSEPRYETISTLFGDNGLSAVWDNLKTFGELLVSGDDGLIWNAVPGFDYLYALGLPLALLGLVVTVGRRRFSPSHTEFLFLAWLATSVVLAAAEPVNINRINLVFLPLIFFAAVGVRVVAASRLITNALVGPHRRILAERLLLAGLVAVFCISFLRFSDKYFGSYREEASAAFFSSFGDAINRAADSTSGPLCITGRVNQPYVFVLFYRRLDPRIFIRTVQYENPGAQFQNVLSFDRFTFGLEQCDPGITQGYVADRDEENLIDHSRFSTERVGRFVVGLRR